MSIGVSLDRNQQETRGKNTPFEGHPQRLLVLWINLLDSGHLFICMSRFNRSVAKDLTFRPSGWSLRLPLLALKKFSYHVDKTQKLVAIKLSDASDNLRLVEMPSYWKTSLQVSLGWLAKKLKLRSEKLVSQIPWFILSFLYNSNNSNGHFGVHPPFLDKPIYGLPFVCKSSAFDMDHEKHNPRGRAKQAHSMAHTQSNSHGKTCALVIGTITPLHQRKWHSTHSCSICKG